MAKQDWLGPLNQMRSELQSLDSKIRVVSQRMRVIEKNEQIIGNTLIKHNKKLKLLERSGGVAAPSPEIRISKDDEGLSKQIDEVNVLVKDLIKEISFNRELVDKMRQDVNEMKYILDTVNPMEYVTVNQVGDLIDEKIKKSE